MVHIDVIDLLHDTARSYLIKKQLQLTDCSISLQMNVLLSKLARKKINICYDQLTYKKLILNRPPDEFVKQNGSALNSEESIVSFSDIEM